MNKQVLSYFDSIYSHTSLTKQQSYALFRSVLLGEMSPEQLSALLVALKMKGESSQEIAGAAEAMRDSARSFERPDYDFSDLVGTGGDGLNTINISSAAAVVAASCSVKVAKHGNRSVSSKSGSSDLFSGFGLQLDASPATARKCLDEANLCFLAAPNYHLGMKHVMPVRLSLKTRTIFNILGPLANPAKPSHGIYGVYTPDLLDTYAKSLQELGHKNAFVVHGSGLDEIALHGPSQIIYLHNDNLEHITISPSDFGIAEQSLEKIKGDSPEYNVKAIKNVFAGKGELAHTHAIAINAASLLYLHQPNKNLQTHFSTVMEAISMAKPLKNIEQAARITQEA